MVLHETLRLFEAWATAGWVMSEMKRDQRTGSVTGSSRPNIGRPTGRLGDQRGRWGRAGLYDVLRCARITAADQPHAALHRRHGSISAATSSRRYSTGGAATCRCATGRAPRRGRRAMRSSRGATPRRSGAISPAPWVSRWPPRSGSCWTTLGPGRQSSDKVTG